MARLLYELSISIKFFVYESSRQQERGTVTPLNAETEGAIESACINEVSILRGLNLQKMYGLSFLRNSKLSIIMSCSWLKIHTVEPPFYGHQGAKKKLAVLARVSLQKNAYVILPGQPKIVAVITR